MEFKTDGSRAGLTRKKNEVELSAIRFLAPNAICFEIATMISCPATSTVVSFKAELSRRKLFEWLET